MEKRRGRASVREAALRRNASFAYYGMPNRVAVPKQRAKPQPGLDIDAIHKKQTDLEGPVKRAVGDLLHTHPRVLFAVRQNSGAMPYDRNGRAIPVWFYKIARWPEEMTIVDFWGFMRDGRPLAIECKRPSWTKPSDRREKKQQAFIQMCESIGGVGGFVRSVDEAQAVLAL